MLWRRRRSVAILYIKVISTTLLIFLLGRTYLTSEPEDYPDPIIIHIAPRKLPVNPAEVLPRSTVVITVVKDISKKPPPPLRIRKGYDEFEWPQRLGSGFGKEFQSRPTPWQVRWNRSVATRSVSSGNVRKILLYDTFNWWQFNGQLDCPLAPQLPCQMKDNDRDEDWETLAADIDASIFVRDFAHTKEVTKQLAISPNVTGIYFTLESPLAGAVEVPLNPLRVYFASYWRGADIYAPYGRWVSFDSNTKVMHKRPGKNYAEGRAKMAAIVVSNCQTSNNRMNYVRELQKYIKVDVYGSCGTFSCPFDCFDKLKVEYKFYLAFENSNCRDYITDKFYYSALQHEMVPVVMGAHPEDYAAVAPPHSYIHVEQFSSIKALADYLKLLHANDTLYNEYFGWKGSGSFSPMHFLCEACAFVHAQTHPDFKYELPDSQQSFLNPEEIYENVKFDWDSGNEMLCLPDVEWYWNPVA